MISLLQIPNQNFKFRADGELYDITIKTTRYATHISITRDDTVIISNQILIPNTLIIPYDYLVTNGNFALQTQDNDLPDYTKFGVTQFLYYFTNAEIEEAQNA